MGRTIRVFLSSPFKGLGEDRNILHKHVFDDISQRCEKNGFSFQVVDLRWGITEEDTKNHQTIKICLDEIKRSQTLSPHPNFLVLTGNRYGWIPLPFEITKRQWDLIVANSTPRGIEVLNNCYREDKNSLERIYRRKIGAKVDEKEVASILFPHAKDMEEREAVYFGSSATEQEIYAGLIVPKARHHTIVVVRTDEPFASDDASKNKELIKLLESHTDYLVKYRYVEHGKPEEWEALWKPVKQYLIQIVDDRMQEELAKESQHSLEERQLEQKKDDIKGSASQYIDINGTYERFVEKAESLETEVLLVVGRQGSGKTMLLKKYAEDTDAITVFTDIDFHCRDVRQVVEKIVSELYRKKVLKEYIEKKLEESYMDYFKRVLQKTKPKKKTAIVIDCLDQIADREIFVNQVNELSLPVNLTLVLSMSEEAIESLRNRDRISGIDRFELPSANVYTAMDILKKMLERKGRTLTESQYQYTANHLPKSISPLYLYELSEILSELRDDSSMPDVFAQDDRQMIYGVIERKKIHFSPILLKRTLGYIALSDSGLREKEVIDLLCTDKEVAREIEDNSFHVYNTVEQAVSVIWIRLINNMTDMLEYVVVDDEAVVRYKHGLMASTVLSIIDNDRMDMLENMCRYFERLPDFYENNRPNFRKIKEYVPALKQLERKDKMAVYLYDQKVEQAWIMAGRYYELMDSLWLLSTEPYYSRYLNERLDLLSRHEMVLRFYKDSFPYVYNKQCQRHVFDAAYLSQVGRDDTEDIYLDHWYLGFSMQSEIAYHAKGVLVLANNGWLSVYDWNQRRRISAIEAPTDKISGFYWHGDDLIIRKREERQVYSFDGTHLSLEKKIQCPAMKELYDSNPVTVANAGGYLEADYCAIYRKNQFRYFTDGRANETQLFYFDHSIQVVCRKEIAAIIIDRSLVHVVNLRERKTWMEIKGLNPAKAFLSEDAGTVLIQSRNDVVYKIVIRNKCDKGLYVPKEMLHNHQLLQSQRRPFMNTAKTLLVLLAQVYSFERKRVPYFTGFHVQMSVPLFSCLSYERKWYAQYYYLGGVPYIRVYHLKTGKLMMETVARTIYQHDLLGDPFKAEGTNIVYRSDGKIYQIDILTMKTSSFKRQNDDYDNMRIGWSSERYDFGGSKNLWPSETILEHLMTVFFFTLKKPTVNTLANNLRSPFQHVICKKENGKTWHINAYARIVHVQDKQGNVLLVDQIQQDIIAADVQGDILYILTFPLPSIVQYRLIDGGIHKTVKTTIQNH